MRDSGNAIVFNIKGTGVSLSNTSAKRVADSYEGGTSKAAKLIVNYLECSLTNRKTEILDLISFTVLWYQSMYHT